MKMLMHAVDFAAKAHSEQRRKYTDEPYVNHCIAVAARVAEVTEDAEVIAAALLHDTLEDTEATAEQISATFGQRVVDLVLQVTDVSRPDDGNRAVRKEIDRQHLALATPEAKTIKLADLINNSSNICEHDPAFGAIYMKEKAALLEVLREGDARLFKLASLIVTNYHNQNIGA